MLSGPDAAETESDLQSELVNGSGTYGVQKLPTRGDPRGGEPMGKRPMRTCRLAFAVPVEPNADGLKADAPGDDGGGVEWRDVRCYATDDAEPGGAPER